MSALLEMLGKFLGIGGGASVLNSAGGLLTNLGLLPVAAWLFKHADEQVHFETSLGFLALCVAFAYVVLEVLRRSRSSGVN